MRYMRLTDFSMSDDSLDEVSIGGRADALKFDEMPNTDLQPCRTEVSRDSPTNPSPEVTQSAHGSGEFSHYSEPADAITPEPSPNGADITSHLADTETEWGLIYDIPKGVNCVHACCNVNVCDNIEATGSTHEKECEHMRTEVNFCVSEVAERLKLVVTYYFDFDIETGSKFTKENVTGEMGQNTDMDICDGAVSDTESHDYAEIDSDDNSDDDQAELKRKDSGSKNNLLEESLLDNDNDKEPDSVSFASTYESELEHILESTENMNKTSADSDDECETSELEHSYASILAVEPGEESDGYVTEEDEENNLESNTSTANTSKSSLNHSMRKGFIYYSSNARLFRGQLCYSERDLSVLNRKKMPLVKRMFRKVFPSRKYVLSRQ